MYANRTSPSVSPTLSPTSVPPANDNPPAIQPVVTTTADIAARNQEGVNASRPRNASPSSFQPSTDRASSDEASTADGLSSAASRPERTTHRDSTDAPALSPAAAVGDLPAVRATLAAGASLDPEDTAASSPLVCAAANGHAEIVDALLLASDPTGRGPDRRWPAVDAAFMAAARNGHGDVCQRILAEPRAPMHYREDSSNRCIVAAAEHGHLSVLEALQAFPDIVDGRQVPDAGRRTPRPFAAKIAFDNGHLDAARFLATCLSCPFLEELRLAAKIASKTPERAWLGALVRRAAIQTQSTFIIETLQARDAVLAKALADAGVISDAALYVSVRTGSVRQPALVLTVLPRERVAPALALLDFGTRTDFFVRLMRNGCADALGVVASLPACHEELYMSLLEATRKVREHDEEAICACAVVADALPEANYRSVIGSTPGPVCTRMLTMAIVQPHAFGKDVSERLLRKLAPHQRERVLVPMGDAIVSTSPRWIDADFREDRVDVLANLLAVLSPAEVEKVVSPLGEADRLYLRERHPGVFPSEQSRES